MLARPPECRNCELDTKATGFAIGEGSGIIGVHIMGEALGSHEALAGLPFRPNAPAGSVLERVIKKCGFDRSQFRISNVVSCRPPNDYLEGAKYEIGAIQHCKVHRDSEIRKSQPKVILALGNVPTRTLTGLSGKKRTVSSLRGFALPAIDYPDVTVVPSFHPSFIRRGATNMIGVLAHDLLKAVSIARHGLLPVIGPSSVTYITHPSTEEARNFCQYAIDNPRRLITYDIENPKSAAKGEDEIDVEEMADQPITQIQFSTEIGTGICFPWIEPYIGMARVLMASPNPKAGHNVWKYDNPILREKYQFQINGRVDDTRWLWHHLQADLPADLQFVASFYGFPFPWKHMADSDLAWYGCADVDAPQRIMTKIPDDLRKRGIYDGYERHVQSVEPILEDMTRRGICVDSAKNHAFGESLEAEKDRVYKLIREKIPDSARVRHPKEGYKKPPAEVKCYLDGGMSQVEAEAKVFDLHRTFAADSDKPKQMEGLRFSQFSTGLDAGMNNVDEGRWHWIQWFSPNSANQIIEVIKAFGHPVPKDFKTEQDTTNKDELKAMAKKYKEPLYEQIIEWREYSTMKSTFVDGWAPGPDGKVHPTFGFGPASGQFNSQNPNAQNAPKHGKLAKKFRKGIVPSPGHVLIELDMKAFHAATLALEAGDPDYMRIAKIDPHSFFTAHLMKLPGHDKLLSYGNEELTDRLKWIKEHHQFQRDKKAKPTILGVGFGLQANHLWEMNAEIWDDEKDCFVPGIESKKEAQKLLDMFFGLFPRIKIFQDMIRRKAHDQNFLVSRHGFMRWFWDVYHWEARRGMMVSGEDAEKAIAYLPANDAFGHMRESMVMLQQEGQQEIGMNEKFGLINNIHDALIFDCPKKFEFECMWEVKKILEHKSEVLTHPVVAPDGFWCEADVMIGRENWAEMEKVKL